MFGLGVQELILILVLVLIFFGAEKIPQLAKSLGKGISEFHQAQREVKHELLREEVEPAAALETETPSEPAPAVCPACQGRTAAGSLYCSQCGERMPFLPACGVCHRSLQPEEKYCPNCGQARA